jgi:hypothetical protein
MNHKNCKVSSNVFDIITFGSGSLDFNGFWEHPCYDCAREWEIKHPEDGPCWPHTKEQLKELGLLETNP